MYQNRVLTLILGLAVWLTAACTFVVEEDMTEPTRLQKDGWTELVKLTAGNSDRKGGLQCDFPLGGPHTVQFSVRGTSDAGVGPNPIALVRWKVGNVVTRLMTVTNGATISGVAQAIEVLVYDDTRVVTGFDYTVSINVVPGTRPTTASPPVYLPSTTVGAPGKFVVAAAGTATIEIPQDSGITAVYVTAYPATPAVLDEGDLAVSQQLSVGPDTLKKYDPRFVGWVPVASSADQLVLHNTSADSILFGVTFGVDG